MSNAVLKFPDLFAHAKTPLPRGPAKPNFSARILVDWHGSPPDWIKVLAEEATEKTATAAAKTIGYSVGLVSAVLRNRYTGDLGAVEAKVRGALMGVVVECPVLGEIGRDQCMAEQAKTHRGTSATRTRLYNACRNGCPHSRLKGAAHAER